MSNFFVDCVAPILLFIVCFLLTKLCALKKISPTKAVLLKMSATKAVLLEMSGLFSVLLKMSATKDAVLLT